MRLRIFLVSVCISISLCLLFNNAVSGNKLLYGISNSKYYLELAKVHQRYGFNDKAIEMYKKAIEIETDETEKNRLLMNLGRAYLHANKNDEAEKVIIKSIEAEKDPAVKIQNYLTLAEVYEKINETDKALEIYELVLNNCNKDFQSNTARQKLTKLLVNSGKLDEYTAKLENRLTDNPDDVIVIECLAHIYSIDENTYAKAIPLYEKLIAGRPEDRGTANRLIQLYKRSNQYEKAVGVNLNLMKSAQEMPGRFYYERISNLYLDAKKPEEALKWDEKSLEENPDNAYVYLRVAERYDQLKKEDKAEEMYLAAIEKSKKNGEKELIALKLVDFYIDFEKLEAAQKLANELLNSTEDNRIKKELQTRIALIAERLDNKKEKPGG